MAFPFITTDKRFFLLQDGVEYLVPDSSLFDVNQQPLDFDFYKVEPGAQSEELITTLLPGDRVLKTLNSNGDVIITLIKLDPDTGDRNPTFQNRSALGDPEGTDYYLYVGEGVDFSGGQSGPPGPSGPGGL